MDKQKTMIIPQISSQPFACCDARDIGVLASGHFGATSARELTDRVRGDRCRPGNPSSAPGCRMAGRPALDACDAGGSSKGALHGMTIGWKTTTTMIFHGLQLRLCI